MFEKHVCQTVYDNCHPLLHLYIKFKNFWLAIFIYDRCETHHADIVEIVRVTIYGVNSGDNVDIMLTRCFQCLLSFHWMTCCTLIPAWISNHMPSKGRVKYLIHSQTSTMLLSHHRLHNGCDYLSMLGLKLNHVRQACYVWNHMVINNCCRN